jgi:hypothetical protein
MSYWNVMIGFSLIIGGTAAGLAWSCIGWRFGSVTVAAGTTVRGEKTEAKQATLVHNLVQDPNVLSRLHESDAIRECKCAAAKENSFPYELVPLTPLQRAAWSSRQAWIKGASDAAFVDLVHRALRLGFAEQDVAHALEFVRDRMQLIIHVNLGKYLQMLVNDTRYRSQFETGTSGGSLIPWLRQSWEKRLFDGHYDGATDGERVKYGVLNFVNNEKGCQGPCSITYGSSFLVLRRSRLQHRTNVCNRDSSRSNALVGTLSDCAHIFLSSHDSSLRAFLEIVTGRRKCQTIDWQVVSGGYSYLEAIFHGDIVLNRDVEELVVSANDAEVDGVVELSRVFANKNNCRLRFL